MKRHLIFIMFSVFFLPSTTVSACSIVYYIDKISGKIYVANNEDYWLDTDAYIQIEPQSKNKLARLWYGWDDFAQGGVNSAGLFFDGAVTPKLNDSKKYKKIKGNLGDHILAHCKTVNDALALLQKEKIALGNAHMVLGDATGNAVVVEWINGERKLIHIKDGYLIATNFLLSDPEKGNYPCYRYKSIEQRIQKLKSQDTTADMRSFGNVVGGAVQLPQQDSNGKSGGTLYTSFINITDMEFGLIYKLDNNKITRFNLKEEFEKGKRRVIPLK
ncbi:carcinine hydrolase/isopenicillin-N N-acyltransferase family protein [Spongiivirga sp. MCCC 1A20706]|uniref:carcinine hydrolase/isopenicillin-N N-acyltransferase family protein n=1 Tax=Spongiivirga sp. MCCC 1A20706 TaxID=3160963 RepID=UPI003977B4FA